MKNHNKLFYNLKIIMKFKKTSLKAKWWTKKKNLKERLMSLELNFNKKLGNKQWSLNLNINFWKKSSVKWKNS